MTCYHPLKGFPVGVNPSGKPAYRITSYKVHHVERHGQQWKDAYDDNISPYAEEVRMNPIEIPCGQCYGCRLQYSREWADRCMLEMKEHEENWFITLTYDDDHLPVCEVFDPDTGECFDFGTLCKRDLQLFWKRLRKAIEPQRIRYYACGEYGDHTFRPHYHAIVFGLHLEDLEYWQFDGRFTYYTSQFLADTWQNGRVIVAQATWETAAYTARYVMKKAKDNGKYITDEYCIEPEFVTMSRGGSSPSGENLGGIGKQYFVDHGKELFEYDRIYVDTGKQSKDFTPPRYYKRLLDQIDPEEARRRSERRMEIATAKLMAKRKQTSVSYLEMLEIEERNKKRQTEVLQRKEF